MHITAAGIDCHVQQGTLTPHLTPTQPEAAQARVQQMQLDTLMTEMLHA